MDVCPTDIILAPAERIWHLLADPRELAKWSGTKLIEGPRREVALAIIFVLRAGMSMHITCDILDAQAPRQLALDIALPFGVTNHEQIQIMPIDASSCRVTFN